MPASSVSDGETATGGRPSSETSEDTSRQTPGLLVESGAPESTPAVVATIGDDIPTPPDLPKRAKVTESFTAGCSLCVRGAEFRQPVAFKPLRKAQHPARRIPKVMLGEERGSGRLWTVHDLRVVSFKPSYPTSGLVAKVHLGGRGKDHDPRAIRNEIDILEGPLRELQGDVVPYLYGVWANDDGEYILVMEDVGIPIPESERNKPDIERKVRNAISRVWEAGIRHGDLQWEHVLMKDGCVSLIDFDQSTTNNMTLRKRKYSANIHADDLYDVV